MGASAQVKSFNAEKDVPDLSGKVVLITGGNRGLGKEVALAIARKNPEKIFMTVRSIEGSKSALELIGSQSQHTKIIPLQCDLSSLSTVQKAGENFRAQASRLDLVICSAGIMIPPPSLTKDGYEVQFGTNHLGHALLIQSLLPVMLLTAKQPGSDVRLVIFTSQGYMMHPNGGILFDKLRTRQDDLFLARYQLYGQSKLANLLYAFQLAERHPQITSVSIHPGVIETELVTSQALLDRWFLKLSTIGKKLTLEEGARNALWAATADRGKIKNGGYYEPVGVNQDFARWAKDKNLAQELWNWTEKELEPYKIHDTWSFS
ncbi:dehydrogenase with different specificitie [Talaromyces proteolyticus]|uniref:Dehydrogenase with different specificitie n=1 Tax=Talaromyces proteolyticus TaxID=1131652 RepID=A0AAD4KH60_9EURO|nr:dehydrogenase with different specificitie [Talaromyces proteolyticus]KAH8689379.1 dehydrogenase with different specificitie [Talaromyces proteolyticus]